VNSWARVFHIRVGEPLGSAGIASLPWGLEICGRFVSGIELGAATAAGASEPRAMQTHAANAAMKRESAIMETSTCR
jgi:hypothetical protein